MPAKYFTCIQISLKVNAIFFLLHTKNQHWPKITENHFYSDGYNRKKKKEQVKEEPNNSHTARFDSNDHSEHDYTMLVMEVGSGNDTEG